MKNENIHETADVSKEAKIGEGTKIWNQAQVAGNAEIGKNCIIGKNVYIDADVRIGNNCKIQNNCSVYHGVTLEDGVMLGPHVVITNDKRPRAVNPDGTLKQSCDWRVSKTFVRKGASIGARSVVVGGVEIGEWAMIGAGSVVTKDVAPHTLVYGNPARFKGFVCACGEKAEEEKEERGFKILKCSVCKEIIKVKSNLLDKE